MEFEKELETIIGYDRREHNVEEECCSECDFIKKVVPAIKQAVDTHVIGEDVQQPVIYFDEVEKENVRKAPSEEMLFQNWLRASQRKALLGNGEEHGR